MFPALSGSKTYIVAAAVIACVVIEKFLGFDIPGFDPGANWLDYILAAFGLAGLRAGVAKSVSQ